MPVDYKTAREYKQEFFEPIEEVLLNELGKRHRKVQKLAFLFLRLSEYNSYLFSSEGRTTFAKRQIIELSEVGTDFNIETNSKVLDAIKSDKDSFYGNYDDYLVYEVENDDIVIEEYLKDNEEVLPYEITQAMRLERTIKIHQIPDECIIGVILGIIDVRNQILAEIDSILDSGSLSYEVMEEISNKYGDKIKWQGDLESLAKLVNMLCYGGKIKVDTISARARADLAFRFFEVTVGKKSASAHSYRRPILDTETIAGKNVIQLNKLL